MSNWMNEAGEPYMTAAALRFEAELDEMSAYDRQFDMYDEPDNDDFCLDCGGYIDTRGDCDCDPYEGDVWDIQEDFGYFGDEALMGE